MKKRVINKLTAWPGRVRTALLLALAVFLTGSNAMAQPELVLTVPTIAAANAGAVVSVIGSGFGAASDVVIFPGPTEVSPISYGSGWVNVVVPATWSGQIRVRNAGGQLSNALDFEIYYSYSGTYWQTLPFTWYLNQNGAPGCTFDETRNALISGYDAWECASNLTTSYGGSTSIAATAYDGTNTRYWSTTDLGSSTIALATWWSLGDEILESDVVFNSDDFTWSCSGDPGSMDVQSLGAHEEGHTIGLLDLYGTADFDETMYGIGSNGQTFRRTLHLHDVFGAEYMYPRAGRPNMTDGAPAGWYGPISPRNTPDATDSSAPLPGVLFGNTETYFSAGGTNDGLDCAAPSALNWFYVDGEFSYWLSWGGVWGAGSTFGLWRNNPITIKGGRHTLAFEHDIDNDIVEANEADNFFHTQFVYSPLVLNDLLAENRTAPPDPGVFPAPNSDGFEFTTGWWGAVAVLPHDMDDDYDAYLFDDYAGSTTGFSNALETSFTSSGGSDFVLVNGNITGNGSTFYAGAVRWNANAENDVVVQQSNVVGATLFPSNVYGEEVSAGGTVIGPGDVIRVHEVFLDDTSLEYAFTLDNLSGDADLNMSLYGPGDAYYGKWDYEAASFNYGPATDEFFTFQPPVADYYAVVVWKNDADSYGEGNTYELRIGTALANLNAQYVPTGHDAPAVPRNDATAVPGNVVVSPVLDGNLGNTYTNFSILQTAPNPMPNWEAELWLDDETLLATMGLVGYEGDFTYVRTNDGPFTVRGGRHTLVNLADPSASVLETNENDNAWRGQYVWSPLPLGTALPVVRAAPPPYGMLPLPNMDGMEYVRNLSYAWATAMAPRDPSDDYDLYLYDDYTGSQNGFSNELMHGMFGSNYTEFVVGAYNSVYATIYPAVVEYSAGASQDFAMDQMGANDDRVADNPAQYIDQVLGADRLVDVYEAYLYPSDTYEFTLQRTSGSSDLTFLVFPPTAGALFLRDDAEQWPTEMGPDLDQMVYAPMEEGYHPVVVFRDRGTDADTPLTYDFGWQVSGATDVVGDVRPTQFYFKGAYPNPAVGPTSVRFALPAQSQVVLKVYDARGRLVRTLAEESYPAGVHDLRWDSRDLNGSSVASGVYWMKLETAMGVETKRMTVIR